MNNLELWNAIKEVPATAQKKITGGRLSGMTDISPMWRYMELTKHFGPCGIGWRYEIEQLWTEKGEGANVCAFAKISLYILHDGAWSHPIPGIGGSMLVVTEKSGPHTSDEAYKMAVTDALSVACKVLGMGADVYWMAGSKYAESAPQPAKSNSSSVGPAKEYVVTGGSALNPQLTPRQKATEPQQKMLKAKMAAQKYTNADAKALLQHFGVEHLADLPLDKVSDAIAYIESGASMVQTVMEG